MCSFQLFLKNVAKSLDCFVQGKVSRSSGSPDFYAKYFAKHFPENNTLIITKHSLQELQRVKALLQNKEIAHGKVTVANESLEKEIAKLKESAKKHKEELEAYETKAKWSQNKLKAELESHKVLFNTFRK